MKTTDMISVVIPVFNEEPNLEELDLSGNSISDLSPLSELTNLAQLWLYDNHIHDIQPLVDNEGLGAGDWVWLMDNPLSNEAIDTDIVTLEARGVNVGLYVYVGDLIVHVEGMDLSGGTENILIAHLRAADKACRFEGDYQAMAEYLYDFMDQCEKMRGKKLTDQQADDLIREATSIIEWFPQ